MRRAARQPRGSNVQSASLTPVPLPLKGIYSQARSAQISGLYAAELENFRPDGFSIETVPTVIWSGAASDVRQRIPFAFGAALQFIEVSPGRTTCGGAEKLRATAGRVSFAEISSNVVMADGTSMPFRYDGAAFIDGAFTTTTGQNPAEFDGVIAHHDRLYFWKTGNDLDFYHGDVGAVTGALTRFPLGRLGSVTGTIVAAQSMTVNAGHGMNDVLVIITSTGEIVAYEGFDPADSQDWRLLTRVKVAPPMSKFSFARVGGDLWMLTKRGLVSIGDTISRGALALTGNFSDPIADKMIAAVAAGIDAGGEWSLAVAADASFAVINGVTNGTSRQFLYWPQTTAWVTANYPARDWENLGQDLYFTALDGRLGKVALGQKGGEAVTARWVSSWFGIGRQGAIAYLKPIIEAEGPLEIRVWVLADHQETTSDLDEAAQTVTLIPDNTANTVSLDGIIGVDAAGYAFQIRIEVTAKWAKILSMAAAIQ